MSNDKCQMTNGKSRRRSHKKSRRLLISILVLLLLIVPTLAQDPFSAYIADNPKGTVVKGVVKEVDARGAIIDLGNGIESQLRASELGRDRVEDARTVLKVGEEVEAKFTGVDRKTRTIALSIKAKEIHEEQEAVSNYRSEQPSSGTSLGDLLKEQIGGDR